MSNRSFTFHAPTPNVASPQPPVEMLRDAARTLAESTNGRVEGSVFTGNPGGSNLFRHTFYLRTRALNDYTYPLFYVWHNADLYPAHVLIAGQDPKREQEYRDETSLHAAIQQILDSPETLKLVRALLAQVDDQNA